MTMSIILVSSDPVVQPATVITILFAILQACSPYFVCAPTTPGYADFAWPQPEVSPGFQPHVVVISQGYSYNGCGSGTGDVGQRAHGSGRGTFGSVSDSEYRYRPSTGHHSHSGASSWASNGSAIITRAATDAFETCVLSEGGISPPPRDHESHGPNEATNHVSSKQNSLQFAG